MRRVKVSSRKSSNGRLLDTAEQQECSHSIESCSEADASPSDEVRWPRKLRRYLLAQYTQLPTYLADNEHIKSGYRVHFSWRLCLRSMFRMHNETLNIWTHFVAFLLFIGLLCIMVITVSPHGFDYLHLGEDALDDADINHHRHRFRLMLSSLQARAPTWDEVSDRLHQMRHHATEELGFTIDRLRANLDRLRKSVTDMSDSETLRRIDQYRRAARESFEHVLPAISELPAELFESTKHRLYEVASFLKALHLEVPDVISPALPDPLAFLPRWPLAIFLTAAITCLLFSSIFHLFYCRSETACGFLHQLDMAGICMLITGTSVPVLYYGFYCSEVWRVTYISMGVIGPTAAFMMTMSKSMMSNANAHLRAIVFLMVGFVNTLPLIHLITWLGRHDFVDLLLLGGFLYIAGAVVYTLRVPERLAPGYFDIYFHSHTIFHVLVVAAALAHYSALLRFFQWRMVNACSAVAMRTPDSIPVF